MPDRARAPYSLRLTADPDAPASSRLFCAAALRALATDEDVIEDVKLAVSELVTAAVAKGGDATVQIDIDAHGRVSVGPLRLSDLEPDARLIVESLFDVRGGDGAARTSVTLATRGRAVDER